MALPAQPERAIRCYPLHRWAGIRSTCGLRLSGGRGDAEEVDVDAMLSGSATLLLGAVLNELSHIWRNRRAKVERKSDFERQLYRDMAEALPRVTHAAYWRRTADPADSNSRDRDFWQALADWRRLSSQVSEDQLRQACETFAAHIGTHHIQVLGPYVGGVPSADECQQLLEKQRGDDWAQVQDERKALAEDLGRRIRTKF